MTHEALLEEALLLSVAKLLAEVTSGARFGVSLRFAFFWKEEGVLAARTEGEDCQRGRIVWW